MDKETKQSGLRVKTSLKAGACDTAYSDGYTAGLNDGRKAYSEGDYSFFEDRPAVYKVYNA
jgi:hypothetical protein